MVVESSQVANLHTKEATRFCSKQATVACTTFKTRRFRKIAGRAAIEVDAPIVTGINIFSSSRWPVVIHGKKGCHHGLTKRLAVILYLAQLSARDEAEVSLARQGFNRQRPSRVTASASSRANAMGAAFAWRSFAKTSAYPSHRRRKFYAVQTYHLRVRQNVRAPTIPP